MTGSCVRPFFNTTLRTEVRIIGFNPRSCKQATGRYTIILMKISPYVDDHVAVRNTVIVDESNRKSSPSVFLP